MKLTKDWLIRKLLAQGIDLHADAAATPDWHQQAGDATARQGLTGYREKAGRVSSGNQAQDKLQPTRFIQPSAVACCPPLLRQFCRRALYQPPLLRNASVDAEIAEDPALRRRCGWSGVVQLTTCQLMDVVTTVWPGHPVNTLFNSATRADTIARPVQLTLAMLCCSAMSARLRSIDSQTSGSS